MTATVDGATSALWSQLFWGWHRHKSTEPDLTEALRKCLARSSLAWGTTDPASELAAQHELEEQILAALAEQPIEDGYTHPAEALLHQASEARIATDEWVAAALSRGSHRSLRPSLLVLVARVKLPESSHHRARILASWLKDAALEVRFACIQALELWADEKLVALAQKHRDSIGWLADYLARVVRDIAHDHGSGS
jgi:hypothetical protein